MNSLLNDKTLQHNMLKKNLASFSRRFPQLGQKLQLLANSLSAEKCAQSTLEFPENAGLFFPLKDTRAVEAKNSQISALYKGLLLHSNYNPAAEAQKMLQGDAIKKADTIVFFGSALGYALAEAAQSCKSKTIVLVEPDPERLLWAFSLFDWHRVLDFSSCVFLVEAPQQTVIAVLEHYGLHSCAFIMHKAWTAHAQQYFSNLHELIARNKDKQDINERTNEKFGFLWLSNTCKNLRAGAQLEGINRYKNSAASLPFCILAGGPTLDDIFPLLAELKKRAVIVCVDTALRSCLRAHVEPHFIVVADPQYWNARHIADLQAPNSILLTEIAAYPSVFRFKCREIILYSSMFPLGRYIEQFTGKKEQLAAGGSVASTAWDFARFCGAENIYTAGLDLSYPTHKTHAKGSTFEENVHYFSTKLHNSETQNVATIYNNLACKTETRTYDYEGNPVLSDIRMQLYAWWFESKCAAFPKTMTYTLSSKGLNIPGIKLEKLQNLLHLPLREKEIKEFCNAPPCNISRNDTAPYSRTKESPNSNFQQALYSLLSDIQELKTLTDSALNLCSKHCRKESDYAYLLDELSKIDTKIRESKASPVASLIFPSSAKLEKLLSEQLPPEPPPPPSSSYIDCARHNLAKSKLIYRAIRESIRTHIRYLQKNNLCV